jgi:hypothetical protein
VVEAHALQGQVWDWVSTMSHSKSVWEDRGKPFFIGLITYARHAVGVCGGDFGSDTEHEEISNAVSRESFIEGDIWRQIQVRESEELANFSLSYLPLRNVQYTLLMPLDEHSSRTL